MHCLSCNNGLLHVTEKHVFSKVSYDICEKCGGLWLDRGELDKVALHTPGSIEISSEAEQEELEEKEGDENLQKQRVVSFRKCLRCHSQEMIKMRFMGNPSIILDHCKKCGGMWLDGGELDQINKYILWFDKKASPSHFDHFLKHMASTRWHKIQVKPTE